MKTLATLVTVLALSTAARAQWVDYGSMIQSVQMQGQQMAQQMQTMENGIVSSNLQNPQVMGQYQTYRMQGGQMSPEQYALAYASTGGFTPQGIGYWNQTQSQIAANDARSLSNYNSYVSNLWGATNAYRGEVQDRIARGRGESLSGYGTYVNPMTGAGYQLSYTAPAGSWQTDPSTGYSFGMDSFGNYSMNTGNGWWNQLQRF